MAQNSTRAASKDVIINLKVNATEAVQAIIQAEDELRNLKKEQKEIEKAMKDGTATNEQKERYVALKAEIRDLNTTIRANQKEIDNQIKMSKQNGDSINAMRAQLKNLRAAYEDLSKADRESDMGKNMLAQIDALNSEILELEKNQGDFTRQVGNYEIASKPARQALKELKMECQNLAVELSRLGGQVDGQKAKVDALAQSVGVESQEYKEAKAELDKLTGAYNNTQAKLSEMEQKTGELSDTIADSNQRINSFANDQQKVAAMQEGVNSLTAAYDALQGALALAGVKSEAMVEIYAKMQIVQRAMNGLMTIYKSLNKDSNLMIVARQKLEKARLVWTNAYNAALNKQNAAVATNTAEEAKNTTTTAANTAATTAQATATGVATGATFSFRAALEALKATMLSNPITAIALAVATAGAAIYGVVKKIIKANKEEEESEKRLAETVKKETETYKAKTDEKVDSMNNLTKSYTEQIAKVRALYSIVRSESAAYDAKVKAVNELNKIVPEYNGHLDKTGKLIRDNNVAIEEYIAKLKQRAEAEAAMALMTQAFETQLDAQRKKQQAQSEFDWYDRELTRWQNEYDQAVLHDLDEDDPWYQKTKRLRDWYFAKYVASRDYLKNVENDIKNSQKTIDYYANNIDDLVMPGSGPEDKDTGKGSGSSTKTESDAAKAAKKNYEDMLKLATDYYKSIEKMQEQSITTQTQKENARYEGEKTQLEEARLKAEQLITQLEKDPKLLKELQKDNKFLSLETLNNQVKILNTELDSAADRHEENLKKISDETNKAFLETTTKLKATLDKSSMSQTELIKLQMQERLKVIDEEEKKELASQEYTEEQKLEISKLYEEKRKQLVQGTNFSNTDYFKFDTIDALKTQFATDLAAIDAQEQASLANWIGTEAEKTALLAKYSEQRKNLTEKETKAETKIWTQSTVQIGSALSSAMGSMSDMFNEVAGENAEMQKFSKALALGQIAINTAVSIAGAVQAAVTAGGFTGPAAPVTIPVFIATLIATVAGAIGQAAALLKQTQTTTAPRFAGGGLVGNRTTKKTDDKITAKLSEGEYVIRSEVVNDLGVDFFDTLNGKKRLKLLIGDGFHFAQGGLVSTPNTQVYNNTSEIAFNYNQLGEVFAEAVEGVQPVVSVKEITNKQNRVKVKENISSYK